MVDPSVYCGTCFCCHAGRTSICPNGVLLGTRPRRRLRGIYGGSAPPDFCFAADGRQPDRRLSIQVATTCLHGQRMLNIFPGQSVVVLGLGVSGQIHVQLAKARGATR